MKVNTSLKIKVCDKKLKALYEALHKCPKHERDTSPEEYRLMEEIDLWEETKERLQHEGV